MKDQLGHRAIRSHLGQNPYAASPDPKCNEAKLLRLIFATHPRLRHHGMRET